jgi:hypothetical protein
MPPQEQQRRARPQERVREQSESASAPQQRTADQTTLQEAGSARQRQSDMAIEEANVTAGKDGACNIRVQWIKVSLPHADPCRFAITTAPGNSLEVSMEQKSYHKSYQGTSSVQTDITPVAPNGTQGKLTVHDLTTGETVEQPWTWRAGAGGGSGLWGLLKRLFT